MLSSVRENTNCYEKTFRAKKAGPTLVKLQLYVCVQTDGAFLRVGAMSYIMNIIYT
jgi:hypothetical protein